MPRFIDTYPLFSTIGFGIENTIFQDWNVSKIEITDSNKFSQNILNIQNNSISSQSLHTKNESPVFNSEVSINQNQFFIMRTRVHDDEEKAS